MIPMFITRYLDILLNYGMEALLPLCSSADGQCSVPPQGTSCSCCAAAWQAAGRSLDGSSSAGASGPTVSFLRVLRQLLPSPGQVSLLVMREQHQYHLEAFTST